MTNRMADEVTRPPSPREEDSDDQSSSDSEIGLEMECHFSDFELEGEPHGGEDTQDSASGIGLSVSSLGVAPYRFEPARRDVGDRPVRPEVRNDREGRLQGTNTWCTCGHCAVMPTARECVCCREIDKVNRRREKGEAVTLSCITLKHGFLTVCLDYDVLETAYYEFHQRYGEDHLGEGLAHEQFRYFAYRQCARWCWGYLGREVRVVLPACVVTKIRDAFPADGNYVGFKFPGED